MAGLNVDSLISPKFLESEGSSLMEEAGPTVERRVSGVNVSSGDGDRCEVLL